MGTHLEVEQKFDVDEGFVLPDLSGVEGVARAGDPVEHRLEAVYHDTADLRLARARVTLRRRTGGPDAGWHVKLPAAAGARRELHSPLGRATRTPPRAVLAPVAGILRTAVPGPVATLHTRRVVTPLLDDAGRVLAEVADDTVTATALAPDPAPDGGDGAAEAHSWREVEVELVDGDEALLAAVGAELVLAGARPSRAPSKVGRVLAGRLAALDGAAAPGGPPPVAEMAMNAEPAGGASTKMAKNAKKKGKKGGSRRQEDAAGAGGPTAGEVVRDAVVRQLGDLQQADLMVRTGQPDGVHQVRVACRRLRSTMAAFRPVWDRERTDPLREELRWLGGELSGPRDTEVALEHLRELVAAQPVELVLGPVAARLQQTEAAGHEQGERQAQRALGERRYLALLDALDALVADPPVTGRAAEPAVPVLREVLRATAKRLRRRVRDVEAATAPEERSHALHEVRKAGKRVRYTAEVAAGQLGDDVAALVDVLKTLQDELGARQDTVVTRELCRTVGLAAFGAGENAWTYGRLHGLEEARAERAERSFDALWPQVRRAVKAATMTR